MTEHRFGDFALVITENIVILIDTIYHDPIAIFPKQKFDEILHELAVKYGGKDDTITNGR